MHERRHSWFAYSTVEVQHVGLEDGTVTYSISLNYRKLQYPICNLRENILGWSQNKDGHSWIRSSNCRVLLNFWGNHGKWAATMPESTTGSKWWASSYFTVVCYSTVIFSMCFKTCCQCSCLSFLLIAICLLIFLMQIRSTRWPDMARWWCWSWANGADLDSPFAAQWDWAHPPAARASSTLRGPTMRGRRRKPWPSRWGWLLRKFFSHTGNIYHQYTPNVSI